MPQIMHNDSIFLLKNSMKTKSKITVLCAEIYARVTRYMIFIHIQYENPVQHSPEFPLKLIKQHEKVALMIMLFFWCANLVFLQEGTYNYCRYLIIGTSCYS